MRMYVISDNSDTLIGMRLCGVEGAMAHTEAEMSDAIDRVLSLDDVGVLLITEKLSNFCKQKVLDIKLHQRTPLIVVIPDRHGTGRSAHSIMNYVRDSIGIKL